MRRLAFVTLVLLIAATAWPHQHDVRPSLDGPECVACALRSSPGEPVETVDAHSARWLEVSAPPRVREAPVFRCLTWAPKQDPPAA